MNAGQGAGEIKGRGVLRLPRSWWWGLPAMLVLLFVFWNPVGYVGGGADDDRYLAGATCWLDNGPCLPVNHWEGRWPIVGALSIPLKVFGISRFALALPFVLVSFGCLVLLKYLGDRLFGPPVGLAGALIFGLLPVFAIQAMSATAEPIELLFILACFAAILDKRSLLAGIVLGLAFQTRETSAAALLPALLLQWRNSRQLALFALGFGFPLLVEFAIFYLTTGDPLYRRTLSASHTLIPSSELTGAGQGLPFFNATLMQNWKYEPGLHVHWLVDGFVNLLINPKTGLLFVITPAFLLLYRDRLSRRELTIAAFILAASLFYSAALIYGLSIDPKPRMMYVPLAGLAVVVGLVAVRSWNLLLAVALSTIVLLMAISLAAQPRQRHWQEAAERMHARHPGSIETSQPGYFYFSPVLADLPPMGSGKPNMLVVKSEACATPSDEDPLDLRMLTLLAEERSAPLARRLGSSWSICLFSYNGPQPPRPSRRQGSWRDRVYSPSAL